MAENEAENGPQDIGARIDPAAEDMALAGTRRRQADARKHWALAAELDLATADEAGPAGVSHD